MEKKDSKGIGGNVTVKAEEMEAEGRTEAHTEQMVTNQVSGQWRQQRVFLRLPPPLSSPEVWLSQELNKGL